MVLERKILPTFSLIRTDRHLYGFRGVNGLWHEEALGVREKVIRFHSNDYGAVFITNERLVGFTPLLGGFASKPLDVHEHIAGVDNDNGLILISTTKTDAGLRQSFEWVGRIREIGARTFPTEWTKRDEASIEPVEPSGIVETARCTRNTPRSQL
jgi:hypothetical protein